MTRGSIQSFACLLVAFPVLAFFARGAMSPPIVPGSTQAWTATLGSLLLGAAAAGGATLLSWPAALVFRTGGRFLAPTSLVLLVIPSYVLAIGWVPILGTHGIISERIGWAPLYTPTGAGIVQAFQLWPIPAFLAAAALRRADARLEEGARLLAGRSVTARLAAPGLAAGFAVVLALSIGDFGVSCSFTLPTVPEQVLARYGSLFDPRGAAQAALPLAVLLPTVLLAMSRSIRETSPRPGKTAGLRIRLAALIVLAISLGLPGAFLLRTGLGHIGLTLHAHGEEMRSSVFHAGAATLGAAVLALAATGRKGRLLREAAFVLPFALPGIVTGYGVLSVDRWLGGGLRETLGAYALSVIALGARVAWLPWKALDMSLGEGPDDAHLAAAVHGVGRLRRWWSVDVRRSAPALLAGMAAAFLLALGEVGAVYPIQPPGGATISWRIVDLIHYGYQPAVAALCLVLGGGVIAAAFVFLCLRSVVDALSRRPV